jgi:polar amino acid transport system substrate-binding protein
MKTDSARFKTSPRDVVLYAVLTLALVVASPFASADSLADVQKAGVIKSVTEMQTPPFDMVVDGQYQGYDRDLMDQVAKELGVKVAYTDLPWTSVLPAVDAKKFDMSNSNVTISKARAEHYAFTAPIAEASVTLLKRADDTSINAPTDIKGKTVGAIKAGASLTIFKDFIAANHLNVDTREYVNAQQSFTDLANGRVEAVVTTAAIANYTALAQPKQFKVVKPSFGPPAYFSWTLRRGDDDKRLLDAINAALAKIQQDGRLAQIQKKWFGVSSSLPTTLPAPNF